MSETSSTFKLKLNLNSKANSVASSNLKSRKPIKQKTVSDKIHGLKSSRAIPNPGSAGVTITSTPTASLSTKAALKIAQQAQDSQKQELGKTSKKASRKTTSSSSDKSKASREASKTTAKASSKAASKSSKETSSKRKVSQGTKSKSSTTKAASGKSSAPSAPSACAKDFLNSNRDSCLFLADNLSDNPYVSKETHRSNKKAFGKNKPKYYASFNEGRDKFNSDFAKCSAHATSSSGKSQGTRERNSYQDYKARKGAEQASRLAAFGIKSYQPYFHNPRFQAAYLVKEVLEEKRSLNIDLDGMVEKQDIGFASELAFGVIRYLPRLNFIANNLLLKPFNASCYFAHLILLQSLYQLMYMTRAEHAAVYENVELAKQIYGPGVSKVLNACLRNFLRNEEELVERSKNVSLLPKWLDRALTQRIPETLYPQMCATMNSKPPFWIRVNTSIISLEKYLESLQAGEFEYKQHPKVPTAIQILKPVSVNVLPGYLEGHFSVQDLHAQFASLILTQPTRFNKETGEFELLEEIGKYKTINTLFACDPSAPFILDSCCSPGGKTTHLLDLIPKARMIASDIDPVRLERVHQNLNRLDQRAYVVQGDASKPEQWLSGVCYKLDNPKSELDLVLLDIPCSGTGVIRRHPDIKWLRQKNDIPKLHDTQLEILSQNWKYLKVGGKLLYTSCSILGEENEQVVKEFLANTPDARLVAIQGFADTNILSYSEAIKLDGPGLQLINSAESGDGFYYCLLTKVNS